MRYNEDEVKYMNKICLNINGRNHWKIMPASDSIIVPESEKEQLEWCDKIVQTLLKAPVERHFFFTRQKYGYMLCVLEYEGLYYLVHSIRNEFKSYNNVIYITDKNLEDLINIGKMMQANIEEIMNEYKLNMYELRDDILKGKVRLSDDEEVSIKA